MTKLLDVPAVMERYHCCGKTARKIIQQVKHLTQPHLMAYEDALDAWEQTKVVIPSRKGQNITLLNNYRIPSRR